MPESDSFDRLGEEQWEGMGWEEEKVGGGALEEEEWGLGKVPPIELQTTKQLNITDWALCEGSGISVVNPFPAACNLPLLTWKPPTGF